MRSLTAAQPAPTLTAIGAQRLWLFDTDPGLTIGEPVLLASTGEEPTEERRYETGKSVTSAEFLILDGRLIDLCNEEAHPLPLSSVVGGAVVAAVLPVVPNVVSPFGTNEPHAGEDRVFIGMNGCWRTNPAGGPPLNLSDQLAYVTPQPGQWAVLLEDAQPTTSRCPECWGSGHHDNGGCLDLACQGACIHCGSNEDEPCRDDCSGLNCPRCSGSGSCPPYPEGESR